MISYGNINNKNGYFMGIVGGLLGGLIFSIPRIIFLKIFGLYSSIFSCIISYGVINGYRMLNGKIDSNMRKIIIFLTLLTVTLVSLIIFPLISLKGNLFQLPSYYQIFYFSIIKDYIISIIFSSIGLTYVMNRFYI